jgi:hypothetical protein
MLKSIVMINCDICGGTFEHLAVCADSDPMIWESVTSDLEKAAENSGWFYYRQEHRCANCLLNAFYKQEQQMMRT